MSEQIDLTKEVWSAVALAELLGVKKIQMARLRSEHGLPMRKLQKGIYVALTVELLEWLKSRPIAGQDDDSITETGDKVPQTSE